MDQRTVFVVVIVAFGIWFFLGDKGEGSQPIGAESPPIEKTWEEQVKERYAGLDLTSVEFYPSERKTAGTRSWLAYKRIVDVCLTYLPELERQQVLTLTQKIVTADGSTWEGGGDFHSRSDGKCGWAHFMPPFVDWKMYDYPLDKLVKGNIRSYHYTLEVYDKAKEKSVSLASGELENL